MAVYPHGAIFKSVFSPLHSWGELLVTHLNARAFAELRMNLSLHHIVWRAFPAPLLCHYHHTDTVCYHALGQRENVHSVLRRNTDCLDVVMKLQSVSIPATTRNIYLWARDELRRWRGTSQGQTGITLSSRPQQLHNDLRGHISPTINMNKLVNWGPIAPPGCDGGRGASQKPFIILQQTLSGD